MQRRTFIALLSGAAFARPRATHAQQAAPPRHIGFLLVGESPDGKAVQQFRQGLRQAGYTEGRDVVIDWRYAQGDYGRVPELTADLIRNRVDVIVEDSTVGTQAAKRATSTIPIVMALVLDPVGSGLVESLAHPGGNVTGLSMMTTVDLNSKRLQLLKELNPQLTRVAVMWNPDLPLHGKAVEDLKTKAPMLSIDLSFIAVQRPEQFDQAFSDISRAGVKGLYVMGDPIFFAHWASLRKRISTAGLSTIYDLRRWPEAGGLMSYGPDIYDLFYRSAIYVDKILKGAKPADLPVEQPIKLELVINMKTAKALGLTIPPSLLQRADEVIQ